MALSHKLYRFLGERGMPEGMTTQGQEEFVMSLIIQHEHANRRLTAELQLATDEPEGWCGHCACQSCVDAANAAEAADSWG